MINTLEITRGMKVHTIQALSCSLMGNMKYACVITYYLGDLGQVPQRSLLQNGDNNNVPYVAVVKITVQKHVKGLGILPGTK